MSEQEEELLTLTDADGFSVAFRILGRLEWKGQTFAFLEDPEDEGSVMVFTVSEDEDGEENFTMLEDEALAEEVFYLFEADADDYEVGPAE